MSRTAEKSPDVLSQEEIDQLLTAISSGSGQADQVGPPTDQRRIKIYDFKRPDKFSKDQVRTVSIMHEVFARLTTTVLSAKLGNLTQVHVASVDQLTYEEFTRSIPNPTMLAVIHMDPLKGSGILEIDPAVTFSIIDRLFGGRGDGGKLTRELTDIEQSVMEGIMVRLLGNLRESWASVVDLRPRLGQIETNPQFAQIVPQTEMVVLVSMEIKVGEIEGMMNLCIPCLTIQPIAGKLSAQYLYSSVRRGTTMENLAALRDRLAGTEIDVTAEVGSVSMAVRDVLDLRIGDVIRLPDTRVGNALVLKIGDRRKFSCKPGVAGNRIAVQVLEKLQEADQPDPFEQPAEAGDA